MSGLTDMTKTSDHALLVTARTLIEHQTQLDELEEERRLLVKAEGEHRLKYEAEKRGVDQRIEEAQGTYEFEHRILCSNALLDPGTRAFQVGDKAVVVTRPVSAKIGTLKIVPLVKGGQS